MEPGCTFYFRAGFIFIASLRPQWKITDFSWSNFDKKEACWEKSQIFRAKISTEIFTGYQAVKSGSVKNHRFFKNPRDASILRAKSEILLAKSTTVDFALFRCQNWGVSGVLWKISDFSGVKNGAYLAPVLVSVKNGHFWRLRRQKLLAVRL